MRFILIEDNELQKRARYHAKKQKGKGYFVKLNAGNPEYNVAAFNHAMGSDGGDVCCSGSEGAAMGEDFEEIYTCPKCGGEFSKSEMEFSKDCYGIPYRLLCHDCWDKIYDEKGYDGEYYTSADEQIDDDY